jgi:NADH-ubiquinone oxidoreductase chain 2
MVLSAALDSGYVFMALIAILTSVISAVYYLNVIKQVFFYKPDYNLNPEIIDINIHASILKNNIPKEKLTFKINSIVLSSYLTITISILTISIAMFILTPNEINISTLVSSLSIFNT